ncbi:hypothetical protein [Kitasatospora purpeofusca]|uniref:hypothetical protein n=1 Tax=Kitasatospora purpeofusca TaxID=67352 RepID=UPI0036D43E13
MATEFFAPAEEALIVTREGWESLKGKPMNWEAPDRLRSPTASTTVNLAVQMMGSNIIGNELIEAVAGFVSAKARVELWAGSRQPPLTFEQNLAVGRAASDALRIVYESWIAYELAYSSAGGRILQMGDEASSLKEAILRATAILVRARGEGAG